MCHRHTPSSKRNLSTKVFAKSAVTCFLPLTKDFNTFYPGPANLVGLFSGSSRPRPAPLLLAPVPACLPSDGHQLAPSCASQPRAAPACACPFLSACSFLPARPCLLRPCLLRHLPAPAPACSGTCRLCLLPLPRLSPLVCRSMVTSLPFPAPVGPCQSLFATARCRYPRHHAKRIAPSHPARHPFLFVSRHHLPSSPVSVA